MSSRTDKELLPLLRALVAGPLDQRSTEALVAATLTYATRILYWVGRRKGYRLGALGLSLEDLAYDAIAELFAEDAEVAGVTLRTALLPVAGMDDTDLLSAYDATILRTVHWHLPRVFSEVAPEVHLLILGLRQHANPRSDITVRDMVDGRWYLFGDEKTALLHLPALSYEDLRRRLGPVDPLHRAIVIEMLRLVEALLRDQDEYRRAIPEADVLRLALEYLAQRTSLSQQPPGESVGHDVAVLTNVLHRAIERVRHSFERFYLERGRLTPEEFEIMLQAIRGAFLDDRLGADVRSHYAQLREYMPGLTNERYRMSYRRKYVYMYERVMEEAQRLLELERV